MISGVTLKRYLKELSDVITSGDIKRAEVLQTEIIAVLDNEIDGLKHGLTNYQFSNFYIDSVTGKTIRNENDVDFLKDARILKSRLKVELEKLGETEDMTGFKMKKVFISHSSKDAEYVEAFVELLESMGLNEKQIVCSSVPPYCIPLGDKVYDWLASQFQKCDLHVVYVLSENYYSSVASMNEMGAAWVMKQKWTGILMPGFPFNKVDGCIDKTQISIELDDKDKRTLKYRLGELKDDLVSEFDLEDISGARWERKRDNFLERIEDIAEKKAKESGNTEIEKQQSQPYTPAVGKQDVEYIPVEPAFLLVYAAAGNGTILRIATLGAPVQISADGRQFQADNSNRESARWQEALDMLCEWGWVKPTGKKGQVFELTGTGYKKAEWLKDGMEINTNRDPLEEIKNYNLL